MATVNVSWATQDEVVPNAATFNQYDVQIQDMAGGVLQDATEPLGATSHSFLGVVPGDYVASISLMDNAGAVAAPPITAAFTVPVEPTAPVPVSVSVILS